MYLSLSGRVSFWVRCVPRHLAVLASRALVSRTYLPHRKDATRCASEDCDDSKSHAAHVVHTAQRHGALCGSTRGGPLLVPGKTWSDHFSYPKSHASQDDHARRKQPEPPRQPTLRSAQGEGVAPIYPLQFTTTCLNSVKSMRSLSLRSAMKIISSASSSVTPRAAIRSLA